MHTTRLTKYILSTAVIIAVLVAFWALKTSAESEASVPTNPESGDYQLYESQSLQPESEARAIDNAYVGMGDLRYYEWQLAILNAAAPDKDHPYIGMGDLRRFEAAQDIVYGNSH